MVAKLQKNRRLVRSLLGLMVGGMLLLVLLPVWFPWVLKPVAKHYGVRYSGYDRLGVTRFALADVHGDWNGTRLEVRRVESGLPLAWLWGRFVSRTNGPPLLSINDGRLVIGEPTNNASADRHGSTAETFDQISDFGLTLQQWLPVADLTNFTVQVASNHITIPQARWREGHIQAVVQSPGLLGKIELTAQLGGDFALKFSAGWKEYGASLHTGCSRTNGGWQVTGELDWLTNRADLAAQFTTNGWWPAVARADFQRWQIPGEFFKVEGYKDLTGSLTANLVSNRFDLQATALAQPADASKARGFPEVRISLGADGDPTGVNVRTVSMQSSLLNADLTNAVGIAWTGELLTGPAELYLAGDLGKLPGDALDGRIEGVVQIEPQGRGFPVVQFQLSGGQLKAGPLVAQTILVRGGFTAPLLKLDELRADFGDGSEIKAAGEFDIEAQRIEQGSWQVSGGFLQKLLPGLGYSELNASGDLSGPLTNLVHRGKVAITDSKISGAKPFDFMAEWNGQQQLAAEMEIKAGESVLSIAAVANLALAEREVALKLNQVSLRRGSKEIYSLQQSCPITVRVRDTNAPGALWSLTVDEFNWHGDHHTISATADLAWPARGEATLNLADVALADFSDFLEPDIANVLVAELAVAAQWSNGPVQAVASAAASITNAPGDVFDLRGKLKLNERLTIEHFSLATVYAPTLSVTGALPVQVIPERGADILAWDKAENLALTVNWQDGRPEVLKVPVGTRGHLEISQPDLRLLVSGTLDGPSAELTLGATKLHWHSPTNDVPLPEGTDVQLALEVRPELIRLKKIDAKLDGQPVTVIGEWPLPAGSWKKYWSDQKLPDWNQASGRLELKEMQMAALATYLPDMLAAEGQLDATLELKAGKRLEGVMTLTNAATRPLGPITPLRDIAARLRLDGYRAVLEDFRGQIGGQPISADGYASVADLSGRSLDYQINLHGTNVPLARSPELLVRGDIDLALRQGSNAPPLASGVVTLRDGLFVQNVSSLVWSGPVRPGWHPPYFSVTNEPFADWKLDLGIRGDRFLRVRTPVFSGILSADFKMQGSLRAPVLTGDARVDSGRLVFPFGSLTLNQGFVSFNGNDPRGPDLQINASGRNYRYELRLEVNGPADGANVQLSSTPPLASEQILLMLTAGEIPQSDFNFSNSDRMGRLGTFLGTDLLSRYLGTDPAKERLIFRSGESISSEGRLTYSVEYLLTDRWSIIGSYDEFNAFNADLKWKVIHR